MSPKPLVWIIDDDRSIRLVLEKALAKENFDLRLFDRAEGVVEQLTRSTPDAIISDIRMPGMDGFQAVQASSCHRRRKSPPSIFPSFRGCPQQANAWRRRDRPRQ